MGVSLAHVRHPPHKQFAVTLPVTGQVAMATFSRPHRAEERAGGRRLRPTLVRMR